MQKNKNKWNVKKDFWALVNSWFSDINTIIELNNNDHN